MLVANKVITTFSRWVEAPIVVEPTPQNRIEHFGEVLQGFVILELNVLTLDRPMLNAPCRPCFDGSGRVYMKHCKLAIRRDSN